MRRREFIAGLGSAAVWPVVARALQRERMRRMGVLMGGDENDPDQKRALSAFTQALADLGWTEGRNVRMDLRWGGGDANRSLALAQELVGLQPDMILTSNTPATLPSSGRRGRSRSFLWARPIPPPAASLRGSTARVGTSLASPTSNAPWEASGLSCSRRSRLGSSGPPSCSIPTRPPHLLLCPHLRRRPGRSRSCQSLRPFMMTEKSKRPSSPLGASREAALSSCRMYS